MASPFYIIVGVCERRSWKNGQQVWHIENDVLVFVGGEIDAARGWAITQLEKTYPRADGWENHQVFPRLATVEVRRAIGAALSPEELLG